MYIIIDRAWSFFVHVPAVPFLRSCRVKKTVRTVSSCHRACTYNIPTSYVLRIKYSRDYAAWYISKGHYRRMRARDSRSSKRDKKKSQWTRAARLLLCAMTSLSYWPFHTFLRSSHDYRVSNSRKNTEASPVKEKSEWLNVRRNALWLYVAKILAWSFDADSRWKSWRSREFLYTITF